jgi:hypothetical protein
MVWLAGFPSGPAALIAATATHSLVNQSTPELKIRVYGFPGLSAWVLRQAYTEAARMLRSVFIELKWVDCTSLVLSASCTSPELPTDLSVRLLAKALPQASASALGFATSSSDYASAFIFYDRVVALRTHTRLLPTILGRVMAHEISHLLLPQGDHSDLGLMRGEWTADDLRITSSACLGLPMRSVQFMQKEALRRVLSARSLTVK